MRTHMCCTCRVERRAASDRRCLKCKAAYMRTWRKDHPMNEEQRRKDNARSYAYVYVKRGKLERKSCGHCGNQQSQMHHADYSKPLVVTWLCRPCHLRLHRTIGVTAA